MFLLGAIETLYAHAHRLPLNIIINTTLLLWINIDIERSSNIHIWYYAGPLFILYLFSTQTMMRQKYTICTHNNNISYTRIYCFAWGYPCINIDIDIHVMKFLREIVYLRLDISISILCLYKVECLSINFNELSKLSYEQTMRTRVIPALSNWFLLINQQNSPYFAKQTEAW